MLPWPRHASAAALNHPNLCTIYAVDDTAGVPIIAMEFISGQPISQLGAGEGLPHDSLLPIARQIAAGMAAAHAASIVHGDLKPENVMVTTDGVVKILDFGLARRLRGNVPFSSDDTANLGLAEQGSGLFGTPRFLAPEQVRGEPACQASDVFSLGLILYELATGKMPFPAGNVLRILEHIRSIDPEPLAARTKEPFASLLRRILIRDVESRKITMREVAEILHAVTDAQSGPGTP